MQNFPNKEIELSLLLCSKPSSENIHRIEQLTRQQIDWFFFKDFIIHNRIYIIAYKNLTSFSENIPQKVMSEIKDITSKTVKKNLLFSVFLLKILNVFKDESIFVLPFKGPALAEQIYKDVLIRPFSDLDILVDKSNACKAYCILLEKGFIPQIPIKKSQFKKYIKDEDHFVFFYPKNNITLELHWDMSGLYLLKSINVSDIKPHLKTGTLHGNTIPCLSPESLLVYLCVHGTTHSWEYLEQLCCVTKIIETTPRLDWKKILEISSAWHCKKMIYVGLFLAYTILNTQLPNSILIKIQNAPSVIDLSNLLKNNLFLGNTNSKTGNRIHRFSLFHIRIRDSVSDQLQYCLRLLFRPTDKDWMHYPLPAGLSFLHYFLRPTRLFFLKFKKKNAKT